MSWRVGSKVPLNVYDGDRPVCQCHTPEDAARIAAAVNLAACDESALPLLVELAHLVVMRTWPNMHRGRLCRLAAQALQRAGEKP
jgi:hypothetical protein